MSKIARHGHRYTNYADTSSQHNTFVLHNSAFSTSTPNSNNTVGMYSTQILERSNLSRV